MGLRNAATRRSPSAAGCGSTCCAGDALPGPGEYELELFYEGDGRGTPEVEAIARGVVASPRTPFNLPG